ncbi:MAG: hypothetical protein GX349_05700 [Firmicutes bacterium]|nr:hypothetical protein [Bacillota bacterium]
MAMLFSTLGGVLAGIMMRRIKADIPTNFIFNAVIFALIIAQTVLFFLRSVLPSGALLNLLLVLWGLDMAYGYEDRRF